MKNDLRTTNPGSAAQPIRARTVPTMYFIGVTTKQSSIMHVFPRWMEALDQPEVMISGVDLKIHDTAEAYRGAVEQIKYDPLSLGALVTTQRSTCFPQRATCSIIWTRMPSCATKFRASQNEMADSRAMPRIQSQQAYPWMRCSGRRTLVAPAATCSALVRVAPLLRSRCISRPKRTRLIDRSALSL